MNSSPLRAQNQNQPKPQQAQPWAPEQEVLPVPNSLEADPHFKHLSPLGGHLKTGQLGSPQNRPVRRPSSRTRISFTLSVAVLASLSASVVPGSSLPLPASGGEL